MAARQVRWNPLIAIGCLLSAQVFFTLLDATGKSLSHQHGVPLVSLVRHGGQLLLMLLIFGPRMGRGLVRTRHPWLQLLRGLALTGFTLSFFAGLSRLPQAEATAINFVSPFIVMLAAGPMLGEHVRWTSWAGAALGFAGMLLIIRPGGALDPVGVGFILVTVVCNVVFQLLTRRLALTDSSVSTVFLSAIIGTLVSACVLPLQHSAGGWPDWSEPRTLALFASMGVTGLISQLLLFRAYYWSSASFIAPLVYLQMFWAVASGFVFFGQLPDAVGLAGIAVIMLSGVATVALARRAGR